MNKRGGFCLRLIVLISIGSPICFGQTTSSSMGGVRLALAPGMECTTAMRYPSLEKFQATNPLAKKIKTPPIERKRVVTFSGTDTSILTEFSDNQTLSEFIRGDYYLSLDSRRGVRIQDLKEDATGAQLDFRQKYFPELNWVDESDNRGIQKREGTEYLVYEDKSDGLPQSKTLYVDPKTLYPAKLETFEESFTYTYSNAIPIGQRIPLPAQLVEAWEKVKADMKRYLGRVITE